MNLRPVTLVGIVISMVTGVALGILGYRSWLETTSDDAHARAFDEVLSHVHANYVDTVDKDELVVSALKGMLQRLDDHSLFLDRRDYRDLQAETSGYFGGIGIEIGLQDDLFTVIAPIDRTPAQRAGLQAGDRIIEIDHQPLAGRMLVDVVDLLRGEPGSTVHLRIRGADEARDVTLTRAIIELDSVTGRLLEPDIGYVRIAQFQAGTGSAFKAKLDNLEREAGGPLSGLILDLRDNPGGVLQASVAVADTLLDQGLITYTEGRQPSSKARYRAAGGDRLDGAPVVVLINRGSASASEIVAGALQDNARATVMGTRSFGKGSVQSVVPVSGQKAIKLTTAHYFTPGGRNIHKAGIEPDHEVTRDQESAEAFEARLLGDAVALLRQGARPLQAKR
jgi:carboxyl-terminal processing protease